MTTATITHELIAVLRERDDRYWTAVDVWNSFRAQSPEAASAFRRGPGAEREPSIDPPGRVADELRRLAKIIDRQWLHACRSGGGDNPPSTRRVEIFRWRGDYDRSL